MQNKFKELICESLSSNCGKHCDIPHGEYCNKCSVIAEYLVSSGAVLQPCAEGDTVYKIVKYCEKNTGRKEFYRPSIEFDKNCPYLRPQEFYDDYDRCKAVDDYDEGCYCGLNLKIFCNTCKERMAIVKEKFTYPMMRRVYNTPMFDKNTSLDDTLFLSYEDAAKCLKEHIEIYNGILETKNNERGNVK